MVRREGEREARDERGNPMISLLFFSSLGGNSDPGGQWFCIFIVVVDTGLKLQPSSFP